MKFLKIFNKLYIYMSKQSFILIIISLILSVSVCADQQTNGDPVYTEIV
jgi:hypothetical protein